MKRLLLLLIVGGLMVAAFLMPEPDSLEPVATTTPDTIVAPSIQAFAFCPWASTEGSLDAHLAVLAADSTAAILTFPSAGEIRDTRQLSLEGLAGVTFGLGSMPFEGQMPSVVEFTSDASVGVVAFGETMLVGSGCAASIPKIWVLPGGSTQAGDLLELQLFNPFPEDARVNVVMTSEGGFEPEESLDALSVNARSWRTIDMSSLLPLRGSLAATIEVEKGVVIPAFLQIGTEDQALWTGVERADRWEFPLVSAGGLEPFLVLSNPTALDVGYVPLKSTWRAGFWSPVVMRGSRWETCSMSRPASRCGPMASLEPSSLVKARLGGPPPAEPIPLPQPGWFPVSALCRRRATSCGSSTRPLLKSRSPGRLSMRMAPIALRRLQWQPDLRGVSGCPRWTLQASSSRRRPRSRSAQA